MDNFESLIIGIVAVLLLFSLNSSATSYVYGPNGLLARVNESGNITYFHSDNLGTPRAVTDEKGKVRERQEFMPFGQDSQENSGRYEFTGKEFDSDPGLNYFGARYYNPELGRFLTIDPVMQGFSSYGYAGGNPLTRIDPDGRRFEILSPPEAGRFDYSRISADEWSKRWLAHDRGKDIEKALREFGKYDPDTYRKIEESPITAYISGELDLLYNKFPDLKKDENWKEALDDPRCTEIHASPKERSTESGNRDVAIYLKEDDLLTRPDIFERLTHGLYHAEISISRPDSYMAEFFLGSSNAEEAEVVYRTIRTLKMRENYADIFEKSGWRRVIGNQRDYMKDSLKKLAIEDHQNMLKWGILYPPRALFFINKWREVQEK